MSGLSHPNSVYSCSWEISAEVKRVVREILNTDTILQQTNISSSSDLSKYAIQKQPFHSTHKPPTAWRGDRQQLCTSCAPSCPTSCRAVDSQSLALNPHHSTMYIMKVSFVLFWKFLTLRDFMCTHLHSTASTQSMSILFEPPKMPEMVPQNRPLCQGN